jgi:CheY-like chemotaxis protein
MDDVHTVLVIEDDEDIRSTLCDLIQAEGYQALGFENGSEALQHLRTKTDGVCVILLDLMMPVMDGWEFRANQVADPKLAPIPVVVLTASGHTNGSLKGVEILRKPVRFDEVLGEVQKHCPVT